MLHASVHHSWCSRDFGFRGIGRQSSFLFMVRDCTSKGFRRGPLLSMSPAVLVQGASQLSSMTGRTDSVPSVSSGESCVWQHLVSHWLKFATLPCRRHVLFGNPRIANESIYYSTPLLRALLREVRPTSRKQNRPPGCARVFVPLTLPFTVKTAMPARMKLRRCSDRASCCASRARVCPALPCALALAAASGARAWSMLLETTRLHFRPPRANGTRGLCSAARECFTCRHGCPPARLTAAG